MKHHFFSFSNLPFFIFSQFFFLLGRKLDASDKKLDLLNIEPCEEEMNTSR